MTSKDTEVITVLTQLGLRDQPQLTDDQEAVLARALDPELQRLHDIKMVFTPDSEKSDI